MPTYTIKKLLKLGYKQYGKEYDNWYDASEFALSIKKYRYFSNIGKIKNTYYVYFKKKANVRQETSKVFKLVEYNERYFHWYSGVVNKYKFTQYKKSIYNYSWEWNIFAIEDDSGIWNVRFSYYDVIFGKTKRFPSKIKMINYINDIVESNRYGLWELEEYTQLI